MCRTQCVLALVTLYVGFVHSWTWDIALAVDNRIEFYDNGTITHSEAFDVDINVDFLIYDPAHNRMLFANRNKTWDTFIYSFHIATKQHRSLVLRKAKKTYEIIYSLAYDPVTESLFWTDPFAIFWFSLKPGFKNNVYGNVLIEFDDSIPWSVAVDSCRGYIYWTNVVDKGSTTIERARFNGSEREVVLDSNLRAVRNLVIDQQTQKMYWADDILPHRSANVTQFSIESADLNGKYRTTLYTDTKKDQPQALTVSKDFIYWVYYFDLSKIILQLPKNPPNFAKPRAISVAGWYSKSIATNYKIQEQIQGIQDCMPLQDLLINN